MKKLLLLLLCAVTVGSALEARGGRGGGGRGGRGMRGGGRGGRGMRGGGRGGRGGFHRGGRRGGRGRWHGRGGRGWGHRGYWGAGYRRPWFGLGFAPSVVVDDAVSYAPRRPAALDTFVSLFGRNPYSANEFCNWINQTGRSPRQCNLYRAYRGY